MAGRFDDKRILITGGGGNIGMAVAERLASEGALVILTDVAVDRIAQAEIEKIIQEGRDRCSYLRLREGARRCPEGSPG